MLYKFNVPHRLLSFLSLRESEATVLLSADGDLKSTILVILI